MFKTADVAAEIDEALEAGTSYVLTRMGDGEATFLRFARGDPVTGAGRDWWWNHYQISPDNRAAVDAIIDGLTIADAFGVPWSMPWSMMWNMLPMIAEAFHICGYDLSEMPLTDAAIPYYLITRGDLARWQDCRLIVINEDAEPIAEKLRRGDLADEARPYGLGPMNVVGAVNVGWNEIDEVIDRAAEYDFEIALLGIGVRKYAIAHKLADATGGIVLDVGNALNGLVDMQPTKLKGTSSRTVLFQWLMAERVMKEQPGEI